MTDLKLEQIKKYVENGYKLVPIPKGGKAPEGIQAKGWQTNNITDPLAIGDGNCGILLGEPSGWLIDIDFDWRQAAELAPYFLPETKAIFGRDTNKASHYLYKCNGAKTRKYQIGKKDEGGMILELRSTGCQTVFPPSIHKTGETITWESEGEPLEIGMAELESCCRQLAAASIIAKNWVDGSRQELALAIAGVTLKAGIPEEKTKHLIKSICQYVGDPETESRIYCVTTTAQKIADDKEVAGFQKLVEILGEKEANQISKFLKTQQNGTPEGLIQTSNRPSKDIAAEAWHVLGEDQKEKPTLFRFGNELARVDGQVEALDHDGFWQELCDRLDFCRCTGKGLIAKCDPPKAVVTYMRKQKNSSVALPRLEGTTHTPVICKNGNIHAEIGFSEESGFYNFAELSVPKIMNDPSEKDVADAIELIEDLFCDFPFVHSSDKTHAVAMLIVPFLRPMIDGPTPLHLIDKPRQGTGATILAEIVTMVKMGEAVAPQPPCMREEEWNKTLLSNLINLPEFLFIDNVKAIYSNALAMALTSDNYTARKLGTNEMIEVPVQCTWMMTGNNVETGADFVRRILHIRMDANLEDPSRQRTFKHPDLKKYVRENRGKLVWSILTLARAWVVAGKPAPIAELNSYNSWSQVVGGILNFAGFDSFLDTPMERKQRIDPWQEQEKEFVRCWAAHVIKDEDYYINLRSAKLLKICEACELEFGQTDRGYLSNMKFTSRCMNRLADRVFGIYTPDGEYMKLKVLRSKLNGNGSWELEINEKSRPLFDALEMGDIWCGATWDS